MKESISAIILPHILCLSNAVEVLLFDVGLGTVTFDVGARRGAIVVPVELVVAVGVGTLSIGAEDGVAMLSELGVAVLEGVTVLEPGVDIFEAGAVVLEPGVVSGVGAGDAMGAATTTVGEESVTFDAAVKVHVSGQSLIAMHSHGSGKVMNASPS